MLIISNWISFLLASIMKLLYSISRTGKLQSMVQILPAVHFYTWCFIGKQAHPLVTYCLQILSCYNDRVKWSLQKLCLLLNSLHTHKNLLTLFYGNSSYPSLPPFLDYPFDYKHRDSTWITASPLPSTVLGKELVFTERFNVICFTKNHRI